MFERFTEKAIKTVMLAQEESRRLGHNYLGTEQLLLGLIREGTGITQKVLKENGVNLTEARIEVEKIIGRDNYSAIELPFTKRFKASLEVAIKIAEKQNSKICPEHLLLGIMEDDENVGVAVLRNLSVDLERLKKETLNHISEG